MGSQAGSGRRVELDPGEVRVYACPVPDRVPDRLRELLSPDERARARRFRFDEDERRYVHGHGLLRSILAAATGRQARQLAFDRTCRHCGDDHGKPTLVSAPELDFNLTHGGDWVLVALARGVEVGVDVEAREPDRLDALDLEDVLSEAERQAVRAGDDEPDRLERFLTFWTRKEAYLKLRGLGITVPLAELDTAFPGPVATVVSQAPWAEGPPGVVLADLDVGDEHRAALACQAPVRRIRVRAEPPELPVARAEG